MVDEPPEPPEDIADYDLGSASEALAKNGSTRTVWVSDHEREIRWWFELTERVPVRKKQKIVEENTTATQEGVNIDSTYYIDMLEYMVQDWAGSDDPEAPGLRELLTGAYRGQEADNPVFESLLDEVPPPFSELPDADLKE